MSLFPYFCQIFIFLEIMDKSNNSTKPPGGDVVVKKGGDCVCETLMTKVEAGVQDMALEMHYKVKVDEVIRFDIELNVECVCVD